MKIKQNIPGLFKIVVVFIIVVTLYVIYDKKFTKKTFEAVDQNGNKLKGEIKSTPKRKKEKKDGKTMAAKLISMKDKVTEAESQAS